MEAHFYRLQLKLLGITLWLSAEPAEDILGPDHSLRNLRPLRFRTESEALRALDSAGVGLWSSFPHDGIHATLSRSQLRAIGFRGNF
jgi:hypothetical protein